MVFLRPKIIREAADYQALTADRYDYVIGEQRKESAAANLMLKESPTPQLPARIQQLPPPAQAAAHAAAIDKQ